MLSERMQSRLMLSVAYCKIFAWDLFTMHLRIRNETYEHKIMIASYFGRSKPKDNRPKPKPNQSKSKRNSLLVQFCAILVS
jgi:hypothetical protein